MMDNHERQMSATGKERVASAVPHFKDPVPFWEQGLFVFLWLNDSLWSEATQRLTSQPPVGWLVDGWQLSRGSVIARA